MGTYRGAAALCGTTHKTNLSLSSVPQASFDYLASLEEHWSQTFQPVLVGNEMTVARSRHQRRNAVTDFINLQRALCNSTVGFYLLNNHSTAADAGAAAATYEADALNLR